MSFGIIVKSRKRMVKYHKEFINKCDRFQNNGIKGTDKRAKQVIDDYKQVAREGGLKFKDEMPR